MSQVKALRGMFEPNGNKQSQWLCPVRHHNPPPGMVRENDRTTEAGTLKVNAKTVKTGSKSVEATALEARSVETGTSEPLVVEAIQKLPVTVYDWAETRDLPLTDTLHKKASRPQRCTHMCAGSLMDHQGAASSKPSSLEEKLSQAKDFLTEYYKDSGNHEPVLKKETERLKEVNAELRTQGFYELTTDELQWGARTAWRNADRCPARVVWRNLTVFDCRKITSTQGMYEALVRHVEVSLNTGNIQPAITIFRERRPKMRDLRVWNSLVIAFAGYEQEDGSVVGDPSSLEFTKIAESLGWRGAGGMFDLLPWVLSGEDGQPHLYEIPQKLVDTLPLTVDIRHPTIEAIGNMELKWFTLPGVSSMMADIGGNQFTAAPFAGWYQETEISTRDLLDPQRYNLLEPLGHAMQLDMSSNTTLWKDIVALELNRAVLGSYKAAQVSIVDHYTQADQFMDFMAAEYRERGGCPADWVWIVPPQSGALVPTYHQEMLRYKLFPSFEYQQTAWMAAKPRNKNKFKCIAWTVLLVKSIYTKLIKERKKITILYGTETGKSKQFAKMALDIFMSSFKCSLVPLNSEDTINQIQTSDISLFISSTFGNGEAPAMAEGFNQELKELLLVKPEANPNNWFKNLNFAVFGLGSSAYVDLAAFGKFIDSTLSTLGGKQLVSLGVGDELNHQKICFQKWVAEAFDAALGMYNIQVTKDKIGKVLTEAIKEYKWDVCHPAHTNSLNCTLSEISGFPVLDVSLNRKVHLHHELEEASTMLLDFSFDPPAGQGAVYAPGDHLCLYPANRASDVVFLKHRMIDCPPSMDQPLLLLETTTGRHWREVEDFPKFLIYEDLLSNAVDLRLPSQEVLKMFQKYANNLDQSAIRKLVSDTMAYDRWASKGLSFCDALREFPSVMLPSAEVMGTLPRMHGRLYSIASAPLDQGRVSLVVTTAVFNTADDLIHKGLCSGQLEKAPIKTNIPAYFKTINRFKLPENPSKPVIMIGAGSGIAPFRGFWQMRHNQAKAGFPVGQTLLLMGCRKDSMDLLREETNPIKEFNFTHLTAVSQQEGKRSKYVQDLIPEEGALVYQLWLLDGGSIYVCGKVAMAKGVQVALAEVLRQWGGLDREAARLRVQTLRTEGRYQEDIFTA